MKDKKKKFLGIIGGMGPEAGAYLLQRVIALTPATKDQEHIEILLHNNTNVPDRTLGILGKGPSPEPELIRSARLLEQSGVDCIVIACVTAHYYIDAIRSTVKTPILSIIEETARYMKERMPDKRLVGLLATTGTVKAGIFQREMEKHSIEVVTLPDHMQESLVMESIYGRQGIKAGYTDGKLKEALGNASTHLISKGAQVILAGCTEIPLVLKDHDLEVPLVDTIEVLASKAVSFCLSR